MMRSREDGLLAFALTAALIFSFAEQVPAGLRAAAIGPFLELGFGAVVLALAGWAIGALCLVRVAEGNFALNIGVGQIALLAWFYLRSMASAAATQLAGVALPVTRTEILLLVALLAWWARKRAGMPALGPLFPAALWAGVAIFLIAQRELPREVMLSSDPDQHLFFTSQILKLGVVPFHLGVWGPDDFGYPAGFAALCALWSWVSGAAAQNAVAAQPLLQSLLALLAVASLAARVVSRDDRRLQAVAGFLALLLFFGFFPFSLIETYIQLEKAGSISCLLLLLTTLALIVHGAGGPPSRPRLVALALAGAGVGLAALVNPAALVVPGVFYGGAVCKRLWEKRGEIGAAAGLAILHGAAPLALVFADPYYIYRFLLHRPAGALQPANLPVPEPSMLVSPILPDPSFMGAAGRYALDLLLNLQWTKPFLQTPYFGRTPLSIVPVLIAVPIAWRLLPPDKRRPVLGLLALAPLPVIALEFTLLPLFHALRHKGDLYLLAPYLFDSMVRFGYLWYMALVILALALLCERARALKAGLALCVLLASVAMVPVRGARDSLHNEVRIKPRYDRCHFFGCVTDDDRVVLRVLRERFDAYVAAGGSMDFAAIPKILLPNALPVFNNEKWVMPTGASVAVPFVATFPAAFFYTKGSGDYSYANYEAHVCRRLDVAWLRERNIRLMFVPVNRGGVCVDGLETLLRDGKVVARSGGAALIELF